MTTEQRKRGSIFGKEDRLDQATVIGPTAHDLSDIGTLIEPYRQELLLHCYCLLGSLHDAEDLVQETMLRAWRHFDTFKGSASLRTWLYTIATHACLDLLKKHSSRTLLSRYMQAWETDDVAGLVALLKEEATLSMPPFPSWYCGRDAIRAILTAYPFRLEARWRLYPTVANEQPAFALYRANEAKDSCLAFGIQVITLDSSTVARYVANVIMFHDPSLVAFFGLPLQLPASSNK